LNKLTSVNIIVLRPLSEDQIYVMSIPYSEDSKCLKQNQYCSENVLILSTLLRFLNDCREHF